MSRTVKAVGGVITAVAVAVLLAYAYLGLDVGSGPAGSGAGAVTASPSGPATCTPPRTGSDGLAWVCLRELPKEARQTLALIDAGGPFPYAKDGATFNNFEAVLPKKARRYYREYTVRTPGESDRGARRIVTGDGDRELFYTADHYDTFARVQR